MAIHSVITEVRRKASSNFEAPVKLGADQRFVGALLNSHNNNLEEQFILGLDCLITTWTDDSNVNYVTKKFYNGDLTSLSEQGYYILFSADYINRKQQDYSVKNGILYFPEYDEGGADFEVITSTPDTRYRFVGDNGQQNLYTYNKIYDDPSDPSIVTDVILQVNPSFKVINKDILCFRTDINNTADTKISSDLKISTKITSQMIDDPTGIVYTKIAITNYLT